MCQTDFGGQSLSTLKVVDLLEAASLPLESISRLRRIQEMEGVHSIIILAIEVLNWVFNPAMLCESISHILVLPKHNEDLLVWIEVRVF